MNNFIPDSHRLLQDELVDYFKKEAFIVLGVRDSHTFPPSPSLHNDGYGDQENKHPDIFAFDPESGCHVVGIVRKTRQELESEGSLTEYNVFLDQKDDQNNKPYRLYVILPDTLADEFTAFIQHYIHREYWYRIIVVRSRHNELS